MHQRTNLGIGNYLVVTNLVWVKFEFSFGKFGTTKIIGENRLMSTDQSYFKIQ